MEKLKKKYGLWTGVGMVVGIVIGSGVFFKADDVLFNTGGKLWLSLVAWGIGGLIMVVSAYCFAIMAKRVERVNGVVDYVEATSNKRIGYTLGWYLSTIYYPILVSILAFVSTDYFYALCGWAKPEGAHIGTAPFWIFVFCLVLLSFLLNTIAPKLAGKWQVTTTFIKVIPIIVIVVAGITLGLINGATADAFATAGIYTGGDKSVINDIGKAVLATAFAYEGWVLATSINAELKDSKKNLARALVFGTIFVIFAYLLYYIGLSSIISNSDILQNQNNAPYVAATKLLNNNFAAIIFKAFVVISCLGTLNGLTMGGARGIYALADRGQGPKPEVFNKLHPKYNISIKSSLFGLAFTLFFLFFWFLAITGKGVFAEIGTMDELAIALLYLSYFTIYIWIMKNLTELNWYKRFVMPTLALLGATFLVFCATGLFTLAAQGSTDSIVSFLIFSAIVLPIMVVGQFFYRRKVAEQTE